MSANLEQMATKIKAEHELVASTYRKSLGHAKKTGELLVKAKEMVEKTTHNWSRWLEQYCGLLERTASNYIRIASKWDEIEAKLAEANTDPAGLTLRAALSLLKTGTRKKAKQAAQQTAPQITMLVIQEKMSRHNIVGDPKELLALLKELGVEMKVEEATPAGAGA